VKILLVGSDEDSSGSLAGFLQEAGYETMIQTLEDSRIEAPDALVLDALAPIEMARLALKETPEGRRVPLILISEKGCPTPRWIMPGREADAVLPKPLDIRDLVSLLRTFQGLGELLPALDRHSPGPPPPPRDRGKSPVRRRA
jgi:DNA-binding response OmpR family regulator